MRAFPILTCASRAKKRDPPERIAWEDQFYSDLPQSGLFRGGLERRVDRFAQLALGVRPGADEHFPHRAVLVDDDRLRDGLGLIRLADLAVGIEQRGER